jgi:hypothetical protein
MTQVMCNGEIIGEMKNCSPIHIRLAGVWLSPTKATQSFPLVEYVANADQLNEEYRIPVNADAFHRKVDDGEVTIEFEWYVFKVTPNELGDLFDHRHFVPY